MPTVLNRDEGIALEAGGSAIGAVREERDRYVATLTPVDPLAAPGADRPPPPSRAGSGAPDRPRSPGERRDDEARERPPPGSGRPDGPPRRRPGARAPLRDGEAPAAARVPGPR